MNLLVVCGAYPLASETFVRAQCVGLAELGHRVEILGLSRGNRDFDAVAHGDDDKRQRRAPAAQFGDEFGDRHTRRALIDEHGVERHAFLGAELRERGVGVGGDDAAPAAPRHQRRKESLLRRFAVDDHHHSRVARVRHRFPIAPFVGTQGAGVRGSRHV